MPIKHKSIQRMQRRTFLKYTAFLITAAAAPKAFAKPCYATFRSDSGVRDRLVKQKFFDVVYDDDIFLAKDKLPLLKTSLRRLKKIQRTVGYANFSLLDFDEALKIGKSYASIGPFSRQEIDFLEMIFYSQVKDYGFMGEKPIKNITGKIKKSRVKKIRSTGNYLYRGRAFELYRTIRKELGTQVILTSGVRSVMKQFLLFLNKAEKSRGNLSMASRSLAPPGYSFHGVGDFDVGKKGYGIYNFTEKFTGTNVYRRLADLGYLKFRYGPDNNLGVRFEPWHIKVI